MDAVRASLKETGENEDPGEESHQKAQVGTVRGTKLWAGDCMGVELLKGRQKRQSKQRSPVRRSDREQPRPMQPASASASPSVPECACADLQTRRHQSDARNPAHSTSAPRTGVP